jgi:hypothetical protein
MAFRLVPSIQKFSVPESLEASKLRGANSKPQKKQVIFAGRPDNPPVYLEMGIIDLLDDIAALCSLHGSEQSPGQNP